MRCAGWRRGATPDAPLSGVNRVHVYVQRSVGITQKMLEKAKRITMDFISNNKMSPILKQMQLDNQKVLVEIEDISSNKEIKT